MHPYARLTPGPGFRPFRSALYGAQRMVVWPRGRKWVAWLLGTAVNFRHGFVRQGTAPDRTVESLECDGLARLPDLLSPADIAEIHDWLRCHATNSTGAFALDVVMNCPHVLRVITDPYILAIAERYLGCRPTLSSIGIRWSFPARAPTDVQMLHRDPDDWRFLKVFVYLTDVDETSGPHAYVLGSHKTRGRLRARPYTIEDVRSDYGPDAVRRVLGSAGTSFIADTYGIHTGELPVNEKRLIFQCQYSVLPNYALLYDPVVVKDPKVEVDPYLSRLLLK